MKSYFNNKILLGIFSIVALFSIFIYLSKTYSPEQKCLEYYENKGRRDFSLVGGEKNGDVKWIIMENTHTGERLKGVCPLGASGEIDPMSFEVAWLSVLTDATVACLESNNKLWDETKGKFKSKPIDCGERSVSHREGWVRNFSDGELEHQFGSKR